MPIYTDGGQMSQFIRVLNEHIERFIRSAREEGQTLVEYGMLVMLLAVAVIGILTVLGGDVTEFFTGVSSDFQEIASRNESP